MRKQHKYEIRNDSGKGYDFENLASQKRGKHATFKAPCKASVRCRFVRADRKSDNTSHAIRPNSCCLVSLASLDSDLSFLHCIIKSGQLPTPHPPLSLACPSNIRDISLSPHCSLLLLPFVYTFRSVVAWFPPQHVEQQGPRTGVGLVKACTRM
jgi:hypothetical protein